MFWGVAFIVLGLIMILNYVFGFHLPIIKILFGVLLVYWGISIIFDSGHWGFSVHGKKRQTETEAVFAHSTFKFNIENSEFPQKYDVVFGEGNLDLTDIDLKPNSRLEFNTVFGETQVFVKAKTPLRVLTKTVFGKASLPEQNINAFGEFTYASPGLKKEDPAIEIIANTVFGSFSIKEK
ncbi:MAG: hypothetical protein BroJett040_07060 [Oligoflexia bacterium]|nr:MAG: hypothetical protein BroJett040_07060 [Oligoflexia bacterium]